MAEITKAYINKFKGDATLLLQQSRSKFEPHVRRESQDAQFVYFDSVGPVSAQPYGPRNGDTPLAETPLKRRRTEISPWIWAELLDRPDRIRMAMSPDSTFTKNARMAFNRRKDDIIIRGLFGTAYEGDGENSSVTPVTMPATQMLTETGTGVITIDKLIHIKETFWNNDMDEDSEQIMLAVSPNSISQLLKEVKVTSADYNNVKALVQGDVDTFMGIKFLRTTRLPYREKTAGTPADGYIRSNVAWVKSGVLMSIGQDVKVEVDKRPDKKNATQIMLTMDVGSTRMDEKKVFIMETFEDKAPPVVAP